MGGSCRELQPSHHNYHTSSAFFNQNSYPDLPRDVNVSGILRGLWQLLLVKLDNLDGEVEQHLPTHQK